MANQPPKHPNFQHQEEAILAAMPVQDKAFVLADEKRNESATLKERLSNNGLQELVDRGIASVEDLAKIAKGSSFGASILSQHESLANAVHIDPDKLAKMTQKDYLAATETFSDGRITKQEQQFLAHLGLDIKAHGAQPLQGIHMPDGEGSFKPNAPAKAPVTKGGPSV